MNDFIDFAVAVAASLLLGWVAAGDDNEKAYRRHDNAYYGHGHGQMGQAAQDGKPITRLSD